MSFEPRRDQDPLTLIEQRHRPLAGAVRSAEKLISIDAPAALTRLRYALELLLHDLVGEERSRSSVPGPPEDLLDVLAYEQKLLREDLDVLHRVRMEGKAAAHGRGGKTVLAYELTSSLMGSSVGESPLELRLIDRIMGN